MPLWEAAGQALRTMRAQKLKSFFALVGVFVGVTFLVAVVSIVEGLNRYVVEHVSNSFVTANTFELRSTPTFMTGTPTEQAWRDWARRPGLTLADADYVSTRVQTPVLMARFCSGGGAVRYGARNANVELRASDETYFRIRHYDIAAGRTFSGQEARVGQPVIVIGAELADKLLPGLDPIGKKLLIEGLPYQIVGVVAKQGTLFGISLDQFAILPFNAPIRRMLCTSSLIDAVSVQALDPLRMRDAKFEVEALMRTFRRLRPAQANNFDLQSSEDALDEWHKVQRILLVALPGLVSISLVVGAIVIMNIMLMAVSERTREIGIRKALGATRRDILSQFVVEAATISLMGALLGIGAGFLLAFAVKALSPLPAAIAPWSIPAAIALGVGVGVVAGAYPASRAARLDPITALQSE
jgi:putative ABC transport system permease protein